MKPPAFIFFLVVTAICIIAMAIAFKPKKDEMIHVTIDPNTGTALIVNGSHSKTITNLSWKVVWATNTNGTIPLRRIAGQ